MHVGSVVIDCNDFPTMLAFWQQVLGYLQREPTDRDFAVLRDPAGRHVNVSIQGVPEQRTGKNRLHLDLYTDNQEQETGRLRALGATLHPRVPQPSEDFILMEDPEGNVFCVVDTSAGR